jgi:hypothetical protein
VLPQEVLTEALRRTVAFANPQELFTDRQLAEIVLFYGPTVTLTPFVYLSGEQQIPVPDLDFKELGYQPGSVLTVHTPGGRLLLATTLQTVVLNNEVRYCWGVTEDQQEFLETIPHGSRLLLSFIDSTGETNVVQALVSRERAEQDRLAEVSRIRSQQERERPAQHHELLFTATTELQLILSENLQLEYLEAAAAPESVVIKAVPGEVVFVRPLKTTKLWFIEPLVTQDLDQAVYNSLTGQSTAQAQEVLTNLGFSSAWNGVYLKNQPLYSYTEQVVVTAVEGLVTEVDTKTWRYLRLTNRVGSEAWRLKQAGFAWTFKPHSIGSNQTASTIQATAVA